MKNIIVSILFLSSLLLSETIVPIAKTDSLKIQKGSGIINGSVTDETGKPIEEANIMIVGKTWGAETDKEGSYSITKIRSGIYQLKCQKMGFSPRTIDSVFVKDSITTINFQIHSENIRKPIIYIYPEKETEVNVKLDIKGKLTCTYPTYPKEGWTVTAKPNGALTTKDGKKYYSLYWEGISEKPFTIDEGFVVKKEKIIAFLEEKLKFLGLNSREANEFIIYWLPILEKSPHNLIHFSTTQYEEHAQLNITPKPETLIRVFMVFKGLKSPIKVKEQKLAPKQRKGYTVVEWGGCNMTDTQKSVVK